MLTIHINKPLNLIWKYKLVMFCYFIGHHFTVYHLQCIIISCIGLWINDCKYFLLFQLNKIHKKSTWYDERHRQNCLPFNFLCVQKVFSSLHNIQVEPLMADGLFWWCLSYFPGPWQCYLLGSQWVSHKPPGFHPKYLKLCSKDERSFHGFGTTWG